jgi:putative phosphoribosyl transferase
MSAEDRPFRDRREAGIDLASRLQTCVGRSDVLVLGLPRGGVPVAYEVARRLAARLDVFVVRKLGVPGHEELAMGAIASGGVMVVNRDVVEALQIPEHALDEVQREEQKELSRREQEYRGQRPPADPSGKIVILVDDGLATGSSMRAAVRALRRRDPERIVVAVPVAAESVCDDLRREADEVVCAMNPEPFLAVGYWYEDFGQTTDNEVRDLLARAEHEMHSSAGS